MIRRLILCVNLTGSWDTQIFGQILYWVCLWRGICVKLPLELVDQVKRTAVLTVVGLIQSVKDLNRKKKTGSPKSKRISPAWRSSNWDIELDDTTLVAESEEELKSLLIQVKEDSEKAGLKLNIQKTKIMASGPITSRQIEREK